MYSYADIVIKVRGLFTSSPVGGWRDNIQPFSSARGRGTSEPTWEDMGNGLHAMSFGISDELFVAHHIDHDYMEGTDGYPHIHFLCNTVLPAGTDVVWRYKYTIAKGHSQGESLTVVPTYMYMKYTYTGLEVAGEHIVVECTDDEAFDLLEPDTIVYVSIRLHGDTTIIDLDSTSKIYGIMSDLHYQVNRASTVSKSPDFNVAQ